MQLLIKLNIFILCYIEGHVLQDFEKIQRLEIYEYAPYYSTIHENYSWIFLLFCRPFKEVANTSNSSIIIF